MPEEKEICHRDFIKAQPKSRMKLQAFQAIADYESLA